MDNMNREDNENISEESSQKDESKFVYKNVLGGKQNSRIFSVISICFSVLSLIFSIFPSVGFVLGCLGILFAIISRKNIGYFDKLSIASIILGIFGAVFAVMNVMFAHFFENGGIIESFMEIFSKKG